MHRRVIALLLGLILVSAACGGDDTGGATEPGDGDDAADAASSEEEEPAPEPEAPEPTYDDLDPALQEGADRVCEVANQLGGAPSDATALILQTGEAGPVLEPFGIRLAEALGEANEESVVSELAEACRDFGWPGT